MGTYPKQWRGDEVEAKSCPHILDMPPPLPWIFHDCKALGKCYHEPKHT